MKAAVLGGGAWGTALAAHLARTGHPVWLWLREARRAQAVQATRENARYLPGVRLPDAVAATADLAQALDGAEAVLIAVPSHFFREVCRQAARHLAPGACVVSATKGFELETLARMTEVAAAEVPGRALAVLSGPSFALEVAREQPTAVVVASREAQVAEALQQALSSPAFRAYASDDVVGVETAGALKNVIAIAAGIVDGLGLGHNTLAALVTRGLAELGRLVVALGGRADTAAGLAGLGDLVLTCTGDLSRNRQVGRALGQGLSLEAALDRAGSVVEGVRTTRAACALAERTGVDMPIARQMRAVLYEGRPPREALLELMSRRLKRE